jgi:RNA polymerase sigma-70 factor (ECF subfamily)
MSCMAPPRPVQKRSSMTAASLGLSRWEPVRLRASWPLRGRVESVRPRAPSEELEAAMSRIAAGDQSAFAAFYDATSRSVFGIVLSVVRDRAQAEEVAQEVYVEAWRAAPRFDPALGSPSAWLNTIAHRKAVDRVRSAERRTVRERRDADFEAARYVQDTADLVVTADEERRVRDAMGQLSEAQRRALQLAYFEGHSYREVAEYLEVPLGTVKTRIRDALKRLRGELGEVAT